jgi:hypothetical protein
LRTDGTHNESSVLMPHQVNMAAALSDISLTDPSLASRTGIGLVMKMVRYKFHMHKQS